MTLGGGLSARTLASRGALGQDAGEARIVSAYEIARRYPSAKVVFAGGWGRYADAYAARTMFNQLGLDPHRLLLDAKSRNTYENLLFAEPITSHSSRWLGAITNQNSLDARKNRLAPRSDTMPI